MSVILIWSLVEPHFLRITEDTLPKVQNGKPVTVPQGDDMHSARLFYFSDLHVEFCFISPERLVKEILASNREKKLDAVIFGGDVANDPLKHEKGWRYLETVAEALKKESIPFLGVTGNHDASIPSEEMEKYPFEDMRGKYEVLLSKDGNVPFAVSGVNDSGRGNRVWYDPPAVTDDVATTVVLAHNPDAVLYLKEDASCDHMISGHIHGGQIRTPFRIEFTLLRKDELPRSNVIAGDYMIGSRNLFISKGIGCVALPLRFLARPEANIINIPL